MKYSLVCEVVFIFLGSVDSVQGHNLGQNLENSLLKRDADANMPGMRGSEALRTRAHIAHGTVISLAIVLFFPIGGMMMKLFNFPALVWVHAAWQMFSMIVLITGFALGVWLSILHNEIWNKPHEQFGTVIFLLFLAQPLLGLLQHHLYRVASLKSPGTQPSRWLGRVHASFGWALMIMGIVNGGIGLQLGANTTSGEILYGVIAGLVFLTYVGVGTWWYLRVPRAPLWKKESGSEGENAAEL